MVAPHYGRRVARPVVQDAGLAVGLAVFVLLTTAVDWADPVRLRPLPPLAWALILVGCGALAWRRRYPVPVAVVAFLACAVYYPLLAPDGPLLVALLVALSTLAALGRLLPAVVLCVLAVAGAVLGEYGTADSPLGDAGFLLMVGWLVASVALGSVTRSRRAYLDEARHRVEAAERNREEELRRRATEERLRIARDVHDVVGHTLSVITVQAGAALHLLERDPGQAATALAAIKEASRQAMGELRGTLGVLRQVDEEAPLAPAPGVARVPDLARGLTAAGLDVRLDVDADVDDLPAATDLTAYRIVQEALTNVTRHAQARTVWVRVRREADQLCVDVEDDGRGGEATAGSGLRGMRERVAALDGELWVGPRPAGGFRVSARLPARVRA